MSCSGNVADPENSNKTPSGGSPSQILTSMERDSRLQKHYQNSRKNDHKVVFRWKDLKYSIYQRNTQTSTLLQSNYTEKCILNNLNGVVESRQLVAILGPTGCGKTSLINILASKVPASGSKFMKLSGEISINNQPVTERAMGKISAYVTQDDDLYPHLTVRETLLLQAQFFMSADIPKQRREDFVDDVILELGLLKAQHTMIGGAKVRGVSGGERKRVSIATQLITDPSILFLDEPTSGLDGFQAQSVMEAMKNMTTNNRLVMAVIHQPRSSIYAMFDQLMILSEGSLMYHGEAAKAVDYFSSLSRYDQEFTCPNNYNPSDFFLDLLSPDHRSAILSLTHLALSASHILIIPRSPDLAKDSHERILHFRNQFIEFQAKYPVTHTISSDSSLNSLTQIHEPETTSSVLSLIRKNFESYVLLVWRCFTESRRDVATQRIRVFIALFFCLVVGGLYSNGDHGQASIYNRAGFFFFISINQGYSAVTSAVNVLVREKIIVNREVAGNAYTFLTYFLAKFTSELPFTLLPTLCFALIMYWLVDLNPSAANYGMFIFILLEEVVCALSLGLAVSAFAPTVEAAMAISAPLLTCLILFSGFYINISSLPVVANWIPYISFIRWSFQALAINEFQGSSIRCSSKDLEAGQCITEGNQVLRNYFKANHSISYPLMGQFILILLFLTIAYLLLVASRVRYISVGHVGSQVKALENKSSLSSSGAYAAVASSEASTLPQKAPNSDPSASALAMEGAVSPTAGEESQSGVELV